MQESTTLVDEYTQSPADRHLVRDFIIFQVKLILDGLKDVILGPVSFVAFLISLVTGNQAFYEILERGHDVERSINLFGAVREGPDWTDAFVEPPDDRPFEAD